MTICRQMLVNRLYLGLHLKNSMKSTLPCYKVGWLVEKEMTAGTSVERVIERDFHFPCPCGATIKVHGKTATCTACNKTIEVRRVRKHHHRWKLIPPRQGTQSVRVADLATLAIVTALCVLLLAWGLYDLLAWLYDLPVS